MDPEIVTDIMHNYIAAFLTHHFEILNHKAGTIENVKSTIRHHYKRNLRLEDGSMHNTITGSHVGNPCDSIEVKELVSGSYNVSKDRGSSKREEPMRIECLNSMSTCMLLCLESHPNCRVEVLHFLAACSTAFCLWMLIDELINGKCKHSDLNLEKTINDVICITKLQHADEKKIKKNKRKSRVHEVHKLSEIEKGGCVKTFVDTWLVELEKNLRRPLRRDDYFFPTLTKEGKLKSRKKMMQKTFMDLLNKWCKTTVVFIVINGCDGYFVFHCFRCGALQHWFLRCVRRKMSMICAKWWGGWLENEKVETMMKCLLEELSNKENSLQDRHLPHVNHERR